MDILPEILSLIVELLDDIDVVIIAHVNKQWRQLCLKKVSEAYNKSEFLYLVARKGYLKICKWLHVGLYCML